VAPEGSQEAESLSERLNRLETRMERVELDNGERQLAVLSALEKVLNQLRARERKRERDNGDEPPEELTPAPSTPGGNYHTAALARRFRRW
jgi:hypothetical protein